MGVIKPVGVETATQMSTTSERRNTFPFDAEVPFISGTNYRLGNMAPTPLAKSLNMLSDMLNEFALYKEKYLFLEAP